jgi:DNA-binding phage protein
MILESLTKAIQKSGKSRYKISKDTGIDNAVLCRIVSGGSCSIETADKLCKYLGLEIVPKKRKRKAGKQK